MSSQHDYHHATLGFPLERREWLTCQVQGTPTRTRIRAGLRFQLSGGPPVCPGDATRTFFRVLASIAALSGLNFRSIDVSTTHLYRNIDGEVYMESPWNTETEVLFWKGMGRVLGQKQMCI